MSLIRSSRFIYWCRCILSGIDYQI